MCVCVCVCHSASAYFARDNVGLPGFAAHFKYASDEEREVRATHTHTQSRTHTRARSQTQTHARARARSCNVKPDSALKSECHSVHVCLWAHACVVCVCLQHALRLMEFQTRRGGRVVLAALMPPMAEFENEGTYVHTYTHTHTHTHIHRQTDTHAHTGRHTRRVLKGMADVPRMCT